MPEPADAAIELEGVGRDYGERVALREVSLRLERGGTLAVLGPNGAGKTTLLRILATLLRPHAGRARVLGRELPQEGWAVRGSIGFLGHEPLLYSDLTARENLDHHARLHRVARERVQELLEATGMAGRASEPLRTLSRGMVQRVAICRAVLHRPSLLLLDEPLAHLDPAAAELVDPLIGRGSDATRVVVSHDPAGALPQSDLVLGLRAGRAALLAPAEKTTSAELAALYTMQRRPAVTTIAALLRKDLLAELRRRETVPAMALFSLTAFVVFHFGLDQPSSSGRAGRRGAVGDPGARLAAGRQPPVRGRARAGRLRRLPAGAGGPHALLVAKAIALFCFLTASSWWRCRCSQCSCSAPPAPAPSELIDPPAGQRRHRRGRHAHLGAGGAHLRARADRPPRRPAPDRSRCSSRPRVPRPAAGRWRPRPAAGMLAGDSRAL